MEVSPAIDHVCRVQVLPKSWIRQTILCTAARGSLSVPLTASIHREVPSVPHLAMSVPLFLPSAFS